MSFTLKIEKREEFYPIYVKWCKLHGFPEITSAWFPENAFVAYKNDIACHGIWFWNTDSALALVGYPISNKEADSEFKKGGLDFLYQEVEKYAKKEGYVSICTYSHNERPTVIESLKNNGYLVGDTNVVNLIKIL